MTETLKTLMHERAAEPHFAAPDLDLLVRDGERRLRRRRGGAVVGGLAAAAVLGALVVPQLSGSDGDGTGPDVARDPGAPLPVTWATGSVIHDGDRTVDVGLEVNAFVRTSTGFVFADPKGYVYSVVDGRVSDVGRTDAKHPRLVSDEHGALAGWANSTEEGPEFLVLDQSSGEITSNGVATERGMGGLADEADPAYFYAIDAGTAYWRDTRGAVAVDVASSEATVIDPDARNGFDLIDVEDGSIAFYGEDGRILVGPSRDDTTSIDGVFGSNGVLSPEATYYAPDEDELIVREVADGADVTPTLRGYGFATGYAWLDDDTVAVIALGGPPTGPITLLSCSVSSGTCDVVAADAGRYGDLQLPTGEHLGD